MLGAIAGDIIGSVYERCPIKTRDFPLFDPRCRFTDDTVMTVAVAEAILGHGTYQECMLRLGRRYPHAGYGGAFFAWLGSEDPKPYGSFGNGSGMRASPVGQAFTTEDEVLSQARASAAVTHDHPEGLKGAEAIALGVFLARTGHDKETIRGRLSAHFHYDLARTVEDIRPGYRFDVTCQGSVPEAIIAFLDADSYEGAIRNAVSLGGDSDTLACMAGGLAEAYFGGTPEPIRTWAMERLDPELRQVVLAFSHAFPLRKSHRNNSAF